MAKAALALITWQLFWSESDTQALHELRHLSTVLLLGAALTNGDDQMKAFPAHTFPLLDFGTHFIIL